MRKPSLVLLAAALLACAGPALAEPPPIPEEPHDSEDFFGREAVPDAVLAPAVPSHPHMAPNERSNLHNDAFSSDVNLSPGPLGRGTAAQSAGLYRECASLTFDSRERIVTVCVGLEGPILLMLDPRTLDVLAEHPLPPRTVSGAEVFTSFGGGGYFYLDERDRAVVPTTTLQILVIAATDPPGFRLERTYDLSSELPPDDSIVSALPDFSGRIWFVSTEGFVGFLDPDSGELSLTRLEGEGITNSFSTDPGGGVYVVSDRALYRFEAGPQGPAVSWRESYENTFQQKPGQVDDGSGTTPTLMGGGLVAVTDNADPMNVLVFRRRPEATGQRLLCREPVFAQGQSATDNSLVATDRSIVVENNYGYSGPRATSMGRVTAPGFERIDVLPRGRGCREVWRSDEAGPSVVPKLSLGNGLFYTYTKLADEDDPWYLTAIDFRTGETVYKKLSGTGLGFNNNYAPLTIGPDGTMYLGVLGGLVAFRDAVPPESGSRTPRLRLRVSYRAGRGGARQEPRSLVGAARRGCVRSGLRATVRARGGGSPDPEQVRSAVFRAGGTSLRPDDHYPLSRLIPRRLIPKAGEVYRLRARVTLGDGRTLRLRKSIRTCPR